MTTTEEQLDDYLTKLMNKKLDDQSQKIVANMGGNMVEFHRDLDNHRIYYLGLRKEMARYPNLDYDNQPQFAPSVKYVQLYVYDFFRNRVKAHGALNYAVRSDPVFQAITVDLLEEGMSKLFELDWNV